MADPSAHGRRAQLLLALLLVALFPMFLLNHPPPTHAVKLELPWLSDPKAFAARTAGGYRMTSMAPQLEWETRRRVHKLVVTPGDGILLNGRKVADLIELRLEFDRISERDGEWIDYRPDPHARYEMFLEVLTVNRRAQLERIRLDNSAFGNAISAR